jgi:hypothetical protein
LQRSELAMSANSRHSPVFRLPRRRGPRQIGVKAGKPANDFFARKRRISDLAMLLRALARGEDARGDRTGADELAHRSVEPVDVEKVVLLAFRKQDILLDIVQDGIESSNKLRHREGN